MASRERPGGTDLGDFPEALQGLRGSQSVAFVDVDDNDATPGNEVLLGPESVKGPNTPGWSLAALVPSLEALGLALLTLALLATARRALTTRELRV